MIGVCALLMEIKNERKKMISLQLKITLTLEKVMCISCFYELEEFMDSIAKEVSTVSLIGKLAEEENKPNKKNPINQPKPQNN